MRVTICIGSACHLKGSREIIAQLQTLVKENHLENKVLLLRGLCKWSLCDRGGSIILFKTRRYKGVF